MTCGGARLGAGSSRSARTWDSMVAKIWLGPGLGVAAGGLVDVGVGRGVELGDGAAAMPGPAPRNASTAGPSRARRMVATATARRARGGMGAHCRTGTGPLNLG